MRLINVKTLKLEEFHHNIPPYAILSHTWGDEEVTFEMYQEYLKVTNRCLCPGTNSTNSNIEMKAGFAKIIGACKHAQTDRLEYLWCDTNCIDKTSSAELSEAINSMYAWYRDSAVCYAYLADVATFDTTNRGAEEFRKSKWFTRGWTLQELLAPNEVLFFNRDWKPIADRRHLAEIIRGFTRIHKDALMNRGMIPNYSIAQRMSWAAGRRTSRQEDIAYCLLGLFDISMPLLYGEGVKAFTRLQEQIIRVSDDESIFAWDFINGQHQPQFGLLASSPDGFALCGSIVKNESFIRSPYSLTNLGVSIELPTIRTLVPDTVLVGLNCSVELHQFRLHRATGEVARWNNMRFPVWIWLRSVDHGIFIRSPNPTSRTSLSSLYRFGLDCVDTKLFGVADMSRVASWVSDIFPPGQSQGVVTTGFHVVMSFGRNPPEMGTLDELFAPSDFTIQQLAPRGSPLLSHEIISAGKFSVLLSIVWNHKQQPKCWDYTIIRGQARDTIHSLSLNDWKILFLSEEETRAGGIDDTGTIKVIHERAREFLRQGTWELETGSSPFVDMEEKLWKDQHGQGKVVVHLTFREGKRQ